MFLLTLFLFNLSASTEPMPQAKAEELSQFLQNWGNEVGLRRVALIIPSDNKDRRKLIDGLNEKLMALAFGPINSYTEVSIKKTCVQGFIYYPDCFDGLEIVDSETRFCLPCIVPNNYPLWSIEPKGAGDK